MLRGEGKQICAQAGGDFSTGAEGLSPVGVGLGVTAPVGLVASTGLPHFGHLMPLWTIMTFNLAWQWVHWISIRFSLQFYGKWLGRFSPQFETFYP